MYIPQGAEMMARAKNGEGALRRPSDIKKAIEKKKLLLLFKCLNVCFNL